MAPTLVAEMGKSPPQVAIHAVVVAEVAVASKAVILGTLPVLQQNMKATAVPAEAAGAKLRMVRAIQPPRAVPLQAATAKRSLPGTVPLTRRNKK